MISPHAKLIASVTIAAFMALFCYSAFQLSVIDRGLRAEIGESNRWFAAQASYEIQRLMVALQGLKDISPSDLAPQREAIDTRFEILLSRLYLMVDPNQVPYFDGMGVKADLNHAITSLTEIEVLLLDHSQPASALLATLPNLEETAKRLQEIANTTSLHERVDLNERRLLEREVVQWLLIAIGGIFLTGLLMSILLWRNLREANRANAALETYGQELEQIIAARTRALQEALKLERRAKDIYRSFIVTVSHQFRTPLSIIDMIARRQIRPDSLQDPATLHKKFSRILEATERLDSLVNSFISSSTLDTAAPQTPHQTLDLRDLAQRLVERVTFRHPQSPVTLSIPPQPLELIGDGNLLQQALLNVLSNAVAYSSPGDRIEIELGQKDDMLFFSVKDQGVGIAVTDQPNVFEPYFRGANVSRLPGIGTGLSLARDIVHLHGGDITFTSAEGVGSDFTVWLPSRNKT